jgi:hypothetical protein
MVIYVPVIVYAAFAGGLGPAMLATVLCIGISLFFLGSDLIANLANLIDVAFFGVLGPILGSIGERLLRRSKESRYRRAQLQSILDTVPDADRFFTGFIRDLIERRTRGDGNYKSPLTYCRGDAQRQRCAVLGNR